MKSESGTPSRDERWTLEWSSEKAGTQIREDKSI